MLAVHRSYPTPRQTQALVGQAILALIHHITVAQGAFINLTANMKKFILIIAAAIIIGLIVGGVWFFTHQSSLNHNASSGSTSSLPPVQSKTQSGTSISVQNIPSPQNPEVAKDFLSGIQNTDQIALGGTVVVSPYALQIWGSANTGGEALMEYASSTGWTLLSLGGGEWSVLSLIEEGVPVSLAEQLAAGLTNGTSTSPIPTSSLITSPSGGTITIGTSKGSVTINNFYNTAAFISQDQQTVVIADTSNYVVTYNITGSDFGIILLSVPPGVAQQVAESGLLAALGISQQDACKLNVREWVSASVSSQYAGQVSPLSFCGVPSAL